MSTIQLNSTDTFHLEQLDNGKFRVRIKASDGRVRGLIHHIEVGHNLNHHTEYSVEDLLIPSDVPSCMFNTRDDAMKAALTIRKNKPPEVIFTTEIKFDQVNGRVVLSQKQDR